MQHIVKNNQWLGDVILQCSGSISMLFDLAKLNNKSITDDLIVGGFLNTDINKVEKHIKKHYEIKDIVPATAISKIIENECIGGIGCMQIEVDFIVSGEPTQGIGDMNIEETLEIY